MSVLNVAFYGSEAMAKNLAKKSDSRDVESYVFKDSTGEMARILSLLRPLKHPDSIRPLLSVLNVSRVGLIEVSQIDSALGEVIVAMKCSEIRSGIVVINPDSGQWVDPEQVKMLFTQAELRWEILEIVPEAHEIREILFSLDKIDDAREDLVVPLDQKFNVQGIGVVGIGYVQSGIVRKHDQVLIVPGEKSAVVRSLQVMDDDVDEASSGDRVGVALRGVSEDFIGKGSMIVHQGSNALIEVSSSSSKLKMAPFQRRELAVGDVIHASSDIQFKVGRVTSIEKDTVDIDWESPLVIRRDGSGVVILVQLDAIPMRVIGTIFDITAA